MVRGFALGKMATSQDVSQWAQKTSAGNVNRNQMKIKYMCLIGFTTKILCFVCVLPADTKERANLNDISPLANIQVVAEEL